uniref:Uncharacterized protein n=1 Tax=Magallana gigas TaxID=29159 RepID=K1QA89_MAGGI
MRGTGALLVWLVIVNGPGLVLAKDKIEGGFIPICRICELIYGIFSPQCYSHCMNPIPYPGPVVSPPQTGVPSYDIQCAFCQFIHGVGSPQCNIVCHGGGVFWGLFGKGSLNSDARRIAGIKEMPPKCNATALEFARSFCRHRRNADISTYAHKIEQCIKKAVVPRTTDGNQKPMETNQECLKQGHKCAYGYNNC